MSSLLENYDYIDELSILTIQKYNSLSLSQQISLTSAIDRLGIGSGIAQDLKGPITSIEKLLSSSSSSSSSLAAVTAAAITTTTTTATLSTSTTTSSLVLSKDDQSHVIILYTTDHPCGFLKFGRKTLYFYSSNGQCNPYNCICLLDFYVEENSQRYGIGKKLFEKMLSLLSVVPSQLAYDRPSPKLIAFLSKHYNLKNPNLQPNRYAIFNDFFSLYK